MAGIWRRLSPRQANWRRPRTPPPRLRPQRNVDLKQEFEGYLRAVGDTSAMMGSLAKKGDHDGVGQAVEEIRGTCVSCHVKFRKGNSELGLFPARNNTISGQVKIMTVGGKAERLDRSNVVVFVEGVGSSDRTHLPANPVVSQKSRRFSPRVMVVPKQTTVDFPNDDVVFHNVFSLSKANVFDLGIYAKGKTKSVSFPKAGLVKVYCNIHRDMVLNMVVLTSTYFSVTDEAGLYVIPGLPDGDYTLRAWHEFGGEIRQEISVSGGSLHHFPVQIEETRRTLGHKNKFGQSYRGKY